MSQAAEIKGLLMIHYSRLQELKKQQAFQGVYKVDPAITLEIKEIEARIETLQTEVAEIEGEAGGTAQMEPAPAGQSAGKSPGREKNVVGRDIKRVKKIKIGDKQDTAGEPVDRKNIVGGGVEDADEFTLGDGH